ncbi:hypothetical protein GCM10022221_79240 [Actinocorallia aurea]
MSRTIKSAAVAAGALGAAALLSAPAHAAVVPFTATTSALQVWVGASSTSPVATCSSTLTGTINDATLAFTVTGATATGCGAPVSTTGLPWTGSLAGTAASINNFKMTALGCTYSGNLAGTSTAVTVDDTATFPRQSVTGSGSILCVSGVSVAAVYAFNW